MGLANPNLKPSPFLFKNWCPDPNLQWLVFGHRKPGMLGHVDRLKRDPLLFQRRKMKQSARQNSNFHKYGMKLYKK